MKISDHAKNYAQVLQNEHEREIAYSGFLQGAKFQRSEDIEKAWQWHKSHKDGVNDFEDFVKAMKDETDE